ncbi:MAG: STAS domain-containing protein [bacterium]
MPIHTDEKSDVLIVCLEDPISMETNLSFARTMKQAMAKEWRLIIVLVNLKVVNSYCLGTLLASHRESSQRGKILRIVCDQPYSLSSIRHIDPHGDLPVFPSLDEALSDE